MNNELLKRILSTIILMPLIILIIIKGSFYFSFLLIICVFISIFEWHEMTKKNWYKYIGILFLLFSFYTIYKIRNSFDSEYFHLLLITLVCIATDVGGFLFGKLIKGPKITKISPNKTYAGMLGSFLLPIILFYILSENIYFKYSYNLNSKIIIFIILVSAVCQIGDLIISYFKRISKVKDTGKIIPGHGGLLDRIDGMIFAFPFSYLIMITNNIKIF